MCWVAFFNWFIPQTFFISTTSSIPLKLWLWTIVLLLTEIRSRNKYFLHTVHIKATSSLQEDCFIFARNCTNLMLLPQIVQQRLVYSPFIQFIFLTAKTSNKKFVCSRNWIWHLSVMSQQCWWHVSSKLFSIYEPAWLLSANLSTWTLFFKIVTIYKPVTSLPETLVAQKDATRIDGIICFGGHGFETRWWERLHLPITLRLKITLQLCAMNSLSSIVLLVVQALELHWLLLVFLLYLGQAFASNCIW